MRDLMRDHIGGGKIAPRPHTLIQQTEKLGVQIGAAVSRAVEWPRGTRGTAATALRHTGKHYELRRNILPAKLFIENRAPNFFRGGQHLRGKLRHLSVRFADATALLNRGAAAGEQRCHVDPGEISDGENGQHAHDSQASGAGTPPAAPHDHIAAFSYPAQTHICSPVKFSLPRQRISLEIVQ